MEKELQLYCSRQTFDVARVLGCLMIFCCHASLFYHNYFLIFLLPFFSFSLFPVMAWRLLGLVFVRCCVCRVLLRSLAFIPLFIILSIMTGIFLPLGFC